VPNADLCRYLYVRLLSLRPLLLMASKREARPPMHNVLGDEVIRVCCNSCVSTACRLIDTLFINLGTLYRSSGWHSVYCKQFTVQIPSQIYTDDI
jgi:hypothetical protein